MQVVAAEHGDAAVARHRQVDIETIAVGQLGHLAAGHVDARQVGDLGLLDQRVDAAPVRRPVRMGEAAVDRRGDRRLAAGHVDHRQLPGRVVDPLVLAALQVGDALAVRRPGRARGPVRIEVGAGEGGELALLRTGAGVDDVDVEVEGTVRVGAAPGDVGDLPAVRRPRGQLLVVLPVSEFAGGAAGEVDQVQVLVARAQPARVVVLELEAVGDDRRRVLRLRRAGGTLGIERDHRQLPAIRRQRELLHAGGEMRHLPRFAAVGGHRPHLRAGVVVLAVGGLAVGQEGDDAAVAGPLRLRLVGVGRVGELRARAAVEAHPPQVRLRLVAFGIRAGDGVDQPAAVGRQRRLGEHGDAVYVDRGERGLVGGEGGQRQQRQREQGQMRQAPDHRPASAVVDDLPAASAR